jgi:branched-chain amino acid transport system permease protein
LAAEVMGINVARAKIALFVASSFVIGVQGALYAYFNNVVTYDQFNLNLAIAYVAMILIGGLGSATGAVYGALFVSSLPFLLQQLSLSLGTGSAWLQQNVTNIENLVYGGAIILFLLFEPEGLISITGRIRTYFQMWPFGRNRELDTREW